MHTYCEKSDAYEDKHIKQHNISLKRITNLQTDILTEFRI